jgi:SAM-dependent methyltransferase
MTCDLCGGTGTDVVVDLARKRALRSDRVIVPARLVKHACRRCGLVRSGDGPDPAALQALYADEYAAGLGSDHRFFTPAGPVARSAVFAEWIAGAVDEGAWRGARVLEIGAGTGAAQRELARRFPAATFEGQETRRAAAAAARAAGLDVRDGPLDALPAASYDVAYAIAVLEHVPSPAAFLAQVRARLRPGARLVLSQPTQDVPSYDVLFVDHLFHFGAAHVAAYARACGFREERAVVGHPLMPNFSLHVWRAVDDGPAPRAWDGPPAPTTCAATAKSVEADMARLDATLDGIVARGRPVAVFGLAEVFWLARAYSSLADRTIACGLVDDPATVDAAALGFPVVRPEEAPAHGVQEVILAMNPVYYPMATERLARLGLRAVPLLSPDSQGGSTR